jgi:hypothetical protein
VRRRRRRHDGQRTPSSLGESASRSRVRRGFRRR